MKGSPSLVSWIHSPWLSHTATLRLIRLPFLCSFPLTISTSFTPSSKLRSLKSTSGKGLESSNLYRYCCWPNNFCVRVSAVPWQSYSTFWGMFSLKSASSLGSMGHLLRACWGRKPKERLRMSPVDSNFQIVVACTSSMFLRRAEFICMRPRQLMSRR